MPHERSSFHAPGSTVIKTEFVHTETGWGIHGFTVLALPTMASSTQLFLPLEPESRDDAIITRPELAKRSGEGAVLSLLLAVAL